MSLQIESDQDDIVDTGSVTTRPAKAKSKHALTTKERALGLLARREHSAAELKRKLLQKGCAADEIVSGLSELQAEGALSDRRFTEAYVHMRRNRGYGPLRIMAELREKGISADLADEYLNHEEHEWQSVLHQQYTRKYGNQPPADYQDKSKRIGYLQARGFKLDLIFDLIGKL